MTRPKVVQAVLWDVNELISLVSGFKSSPYAIYRHDYNRPSSPQTWWLAETVEALLEAVRLSLPEKNADWCFASGDADSLIDILESHGFECPTGLGSNPDIGLSDHIAYMKRFEFRDRAIQDALQNKKDVEVFYHPDGLWCISLSGMPYIWFPEAFYSAEEALRFCRSRKLPFEIAEFSSKMVTPPGKAVFDKILGGEYFICSVADEVSEI